MSPKISTGAAKEYVEKLLGGPVNEVEATPTVTSAASVIAKGNGDRVGLIFVNLGTGTLQVAPNSGVGAGLGIPLAPSGGTISMVLIEDFTLMSREWYAIKTAGADSVVYVLEYVRFTLTDSNQE